MRKFGVSLRPNAVANSYSGGVGNTQYVTGTASAATPNAYSAVTVLANDAGPAPLTAVELVYALFGTPT